MVAVGDKVRILNNDYDPTLVGEIVTVETIYDDGSGIYASDEWAYGHSEYEVVDDDEYTTDEILSEALKVQTYEERMDFANFIVEGAMFYQEQGIWVEPHIMADIINEWADVYGVYSDE